MLSDEGPAMERDGRKVDGVFVTVPDDGPRPHPGQILEGAPAPPPADRGPGKGPPDPA
jgi:hypothetical protein